MLKSASRFGAGMVFICAPISGVLAEPVDLARDEAPAARNIETVVVSARKRDENIQNVPATINSISGDQLAHFNVSTVGDLKRLVPGFEARQSPNNTPAITLRGFGTGTGSMAFEQSVGTFVDGAYLGHGRMFNNAFFDLDRLEVIEGTQATLLGKNTSLGALSMVTRRPGDRPSYNLTGSYEFERGSYSVSGGTDFVVDDTLSVRVAAQHAATKGWVHNIITGQDGPDIKNNGVRLTVVWKPTEKLSATAMYQYIQYDRTGDSIETVNDWSTLAGGFAPFTTPGVLSSLGAHRYPGDSTFNYRSDTNSINGVAREKSRGHLAVATVNYRASDWFNVTSVTSLLNYSDEGLYPSGFTYWNVVNQQVNEYEKQYSQELRVGSDNASALQYLAGVYFQTDRWEMPQHLIGYGTLAAGPYGAANLPPPPSAAVGANPAPIGSEFTEFLRTRTRDLSVFGSLTWTIVDNLTATVGARYTAETRDATFGRTYLAGVPVASSPYAGCIGGIGVTASYIPSCATTGGGYTGYREASVSGNPLDGSAQLQYQITDEVLAYGSWAKGTKGAGFANQTGVVGQPYGVEQARTYEVGAKSSFSGDFGDVLLNIAAFDTVVDGLQTAVFSGGVFVVAQRNVRSTGLDANVEWAPVSGWRLGTKFTYMNARNTASPLDPTIEAGSPAVGAPKWSGNAYASYTADLGGAYALEISPSLNFRSVMNLRDYTKGPFSCLPSPTAFGYSCFYPRSDAFTKFNLRVSLNNDDAGWNVSLVGENLNNVKRLGYAYPGAGGFGTQASSDPARTVTLQLSWAH